jgi:ATP-binding cassette subfamily F protein 3
MIQLQSVGLRRGTQLLLENANLTLQPGYRLGLVGRNGTGKSSLLALIEGTLAPDDGEIERAGGQRLATVAQEIEDIEVSAIEHVLSGDSEWDALNTQIQAAEAAEDGMALTSISSISWAWWWSRTIAIFWIRSAPISPILITKP